MKLNQFLSRKKTVKITSVYIDSKTHDGETIGAFTLRIPLKRVYGSRFQPPTPLGFKEKLEQLGGKEPKRRKLKRMVAHNVHKIKINPGVLDLIEYDEDKKLISYPGYLRYDVAQSGDVWLIGVQFKDAAGVYRNALRKTRLDNLFGKKQ